MRFKTVILQRIIKTVVSDIESLGWFDKYSLTPLLLALRLFFIVLMATFIGGLVSACSALASHKDGLSRTHTFARKSGHHLFRSRVCTSTHLARKSAGYQIGFIL